MARMPMLRSIDSRMIANTSGRTSLRRIFPLVSCWRISAVRFAQLLIRLDANLRFDRVDLIHDAVIPLQKPFIAAAENFGQRLAKINCHDTPPYRGIKKRDESIKLETEKRRPNQHSGGGRRKSKGER